MVVVLACMCCVAQVRAEGEPRIHRWVSLGNSFTVHPITNFWWGAWGMAATDRESDFSHVLQRKITEWQGGWEPRMVCYNMSGWELYHGSEQQREYILKRLDGTEELVLLRIGECVMKYDNYQQDLEVLIDDIRAKSPNARIVVSGCFWPNSQREMAQEAAAKSRQCIWCPFTGMCNSETLAGLNYRVMGDDGAWHGLVEGGASAQSVANHANNLGHMLMAEALFDSIQANWGTNLAILPQWADKGKVVRVEYFDLSGRRLEQAPAVGISICREYREDGSYTSRKVVNR